MKLFTGHTFIALIAIFGFCLLLCHYVRLYWNYWAFRKWTVRSPGLIKTKSIITYKKTDDISRCHHWFPREMTSDKRAQKFHTNDASLPRSGKFFWLVVPRRKFASTNQKHYSDRGSDTSSVWNFCTLSSDVISRGNQWWRREMSAVFSDFCAMKRLKCVYHFVDHLSFLLPG